MNKVYYSNELTHWGIKGQKWGVRRYQNEDGTLTEEGKRRYRYDFQTGEVAYKRYPKNRLLYNLSSKKIAKENYSRWEAAHKTFEKDVREEFRNAVSTKKDQRTYLEDLAKNNPYKLSLIESLIIRPGKFDSGETEYEKEMVSRLSKKSKEKYNECKKAVSALHNYSIDYIKKTIASKSIVDQREMYNKMYQTKEYRSLIKKYAIAEVALANSQLTDMGFYSDDYSACLILGNWYKNRYGDLK